MSATTIKVPADQVEAIRESLIGWRDDPRWRTDVERLLEQVADRPGSSAPRELHGPRALIWNALYDALCATAERLAEECNEYWRGTVAPPAARARIAEVGARFELLAGLGPPPGR